MSKKDPIKIGQVIVVERHHFQCLFDILKGMGFKIIGPTLFDGAIVLGEPASVEDLPVGWTDIQDCSAYRLKRRTDEALFGFNLGPHSWMKFLRPPVARLWHAKRNGTRFQIRTENGESPRLAFLAMRACELNAILLQDKILLGGDYADSIYKVQRENTFIIAANCTQASGSCFCLSMNAGPNALRGFDVALTEVIQSDQHYFVMETGSALGAKILEKTPHRDASDLEKETADQLLTKTAGQMGRKLNTRGLRETLMQNLEHPYWDVVAERCLGCGNCTMVCPTCFCHTVEDTTDLRGKQAERWRKWDSCFTSDFSYIHGGSIRSSAKARYRQWLIHKFATFSDQFGAMGCVGCGRCITWCPAALDPTEELRTFQKSESIKREESQWLPTR